MATQFGTWYKCFAVAASLCLSGVHDQNVESQCRARLMLPLAPSTFALSWLWQGGFVASCIGSRSVLVGRGGKAAKGVAKAQACQTLPELHEAFNSQCFNLGVYQPAPALARRKPKSATVLPCGLVSQAPPGAAYQQPHCGYEAPLPNGAGG